MTNSHLWRSNGYILKSIDGQLILAYDLVIKLNFPSDTSKNKDLLPAVPGFWGSSKKPSCKSFHICISCFDKCQGLTSSKACHTKSSGTQNWLDSLHTTLFALHSVSLFTFASMYLSSFHVRVMLKCFILHM